MDNSTLKILIVEDDISYALELKMILDELGYQVMDILDNSAEALVAILSSKPDLIMMDIDIKGNLSGTEIGQKIKHLSIPIIYITSFDNKDRYDEARQSNMAAYLIKPASKFTIESTIDLVIKKLLEQNKGKSEQKENESIFDSSFFVKKKNIFHKILIKDIQYIEAAGNYTILYLGKESFISNLILKELIEKLPPLLFIKVHRSYIMNVNYFSSINIEENVITMENNKNIPISRNNKQALLDRMNIG